MKYKLNSGTKYNICCDIVNNKRHYSYSLDMIFVDCILDVKQKSIFYRFLTNSNLFIKLPENVILNIEENEQGM